jgi:alkanesulfonate monooxygenase SsuD/methylene tetrahydromethanopterin reductase-like flavin-dependent oxidoreductase (luciferase family)
MTTSDTATPDLGRFGYFGISSTPDHAQQIERLGYGTIWIGGSPPAELSFVEPLLEATTTLKVATGIVNIWTAAAQPVAESFHRIDAAYPGRFVLGIGVGHPEVQGNTASHTKRWCRTSTNSTNTACRPINVCSPRKGRAY